MRLDEIEARVNAIREDCEKDGADLSALNTELDSLLEERKGILEAAEQRKAILDKAAVDGTVIKKEDKDNKMEERTFSIDSVEYRDAWIKQLQSKPLDEAEQRAIASSGAAVPTNVSNEFFEAAKKCAPMISEITLLHAAGSLKVGVQSANDAPSAHTENAALSETSSAISFVTLGGKEFFSLITISKAAQTMSISAFQSWIVEILASDIMAGVENYIWNDSTNGITKITFTADTNMIKDSAGPKYADLVKIVGLLPARYDNGAKWFFNKSVYWQNIRSIVDSQGRPIVGTAKDGVEMLLGYPVVFSDALATTDKVFYFGNAKKVVGNFSQDIVVEKDEHSGFRYGSIDFRGGAIFDSKPANADAWVKFICTT